MEEHKILLTSPEISGLWMSYMQSTANLCIIKHFIQHVQDLEVAPLLDEQTYLFQKFIDGSKNIFTKEGFPIPKGFSDEDLDKSAPALFTDSYALSFIYRLNQMSLTNYATVAIKVARPDTVEYFYDCMNSSAAIYKKALNLMISKGIYDRPPKMNYPKEVEFIKKVDSIFDTLFGNKRPLNAFELGEIFYIIERNYIGLLSIMGFLQVVKDKEIKEFLKKGKDLAEKQIDIFNKILKDEAHLGNIPVSMEVTDSTVSPFSDRLIMFLISASTTAGAYLAAYAMSVSMRIDLISHYSTIMLDIMKYAGEGGRIMIDRGWLEQPPQAFDRVAALKK